MTKHDDVMGNFRPSDFRVIEKEARETLRKLEGTVDADPTRVSDLIDVIAHAKWFSGDPAGAEGVFDKLIDLQEARYGCDSPQTALVLKDLAVMFVDIGEHKRAETLLRRAGEITRQVGASSRHALGEILDVLSFCAREDERLEDACSLAEEAVAILSESNMTPRILLLRSVRNYAELLRATGAVSKAEAVQKTVDEIMEEFELWFTLPR